MWWTTHCAMSSSTFHLRSMQTRRLRSGYSKIFLDYIHIGNYFRINEFMYVM